MVNGIGKSARIKIRNGALHLAIFFSQKNTFVLFLGKMRSKRQIFKDLPYIVSGSDSYSFIGSILMSMYTYLFSKNKIFLNILWQFLTTIFLKRG